MAMLLLVVLKREALLCLEPFMVCGLFLLVERYVVTRLRDVCFGFFYRCGECDFKLDVKCATLTAHKTEVENNTEAIDAFSSSELDFEENSAQVENNTAAIDAFSSSMSDFEDSSDQTWTPQGIYIIITVVAAPPLFHLLAVGAWWLWHSIPLPFSAFLCGAIAATFGLVVVFIFIAHLCCLFLLVWFPGLSVHPCSLSPRSRCTPIDLMFIRSCGCYLLCKVGLCSSSDGWDRSAQPSCPVYSWVAMLLVCGGAISNLFPPSIADIETTCIYYFHIHERSYPNTVRQSKALPYSFPSQFIIQIPRRDASTITLRRINAIGRSLPNNFILQISNKNNLINFPIKICPLTLPQPNILFLS
ncbi:Uncharacterized protein TCM_045384 [Theobroma cacao]|uniref:Uncharacterized protein n=1 Tax=Theobroma cacao TaxID=3641 RepID=A0A061FRL8_THECC|nr:Uncharacterized protein TCM_045384 [Theobroma cacao]